LSFSRISVKALRFPSSRQRGSRKQVMPPGACARTRKASDIGAEKNHLWPTSSYSSPWTARAVVVLARTSEPPCFSVMPMPSVTPRFCDDGTLRPSYSGAIAFASHSGSERCNTGTAAYVIVKGQLVPASAW
jgi:hypothetical protein